VNAKRKFEEAEAFEALAVGLRALAAEKTEVELLEDAPKSVVLRFSKVVPEDWGIYVVPGRYELSFDTFLLEWELLQNQADAIRALALCDALIAGRAVHLEAVDGLDCKTWVFLDSRGVKSTVTSSRSTCTLRRPRLVRQRKWRRYTYRPLAERVTAS